MPMETQVDFIRKWIIDQPQDILRAGFTTVAFMLIAQGTETMGAFLDKKPFKARGQSTERFALALKKLFPPRYISINATDFLYRQLRGNLTHLGVGSKYLYLTDRANTSHRHLSVIDSKTTLVVEDLMQDYISAAQKLIALLEEGKLKSKILIQ